MSSNNQRGNVYISLLILICLLLGTALVVLYAKGYRLDIFQGRPKISKTGLLVATSTPNGASVDVNHNLTTATNNTVDLLPGKYTISIHKDGYFPWEKDVMIAKELVTKADALLYPVAPKLESITATGVQTPILDPSRTKIAYRVASQSSLLNGIYVYDMNTRSVLSLQSATKQIANDTTSLFSTADISWSPDGAQVLATISAGLSKTTYLLQTNQLNTVPRNITAILPSIQSQFDTDRKEKADAQVIALKPALKALIANYFTILSWSPDDSKILYVASAAADLPLIIKPRLLGVDTLYEKRQIKVGGLYVYDTKEDRNTKIIDNTPESCKVAGFSCALPISWFSDSEHLLFVYNKQVHMVEYDGSNDTVVYAGPFIDSYAFPWPDGQRIAILTDLNNSTILPNLYTISLK
jgi:WD40 repeat protein